MPIEVWKTNSGKWFWTCRSLNGEVISDSAEIYSSRAKAIQGAEATAKEFAKWSKEQKPRSLKKATTERSKPAAKRTTRSSSQTRKTAKRGG